MVLLSHVCATRARPSSMGALPTQIAELRWTQVVMRLLKHHESNHTSILSLYRDVRLFTTRTKKLDRHLTVFQGSCAHVVWTSGPGILLCINSVHTLASVSDIELHFGRRWRPTHLDRLSRLLQAFEKSRLL